MPNLSDVERKLIDRRLSGSWTCILSLGFVFFTSLPFWTEQTLGMRRSMACRRICTKCRLGDIMTIWGLAMLSMGYVKNWSGLMTARGFWAWPKLVLYPGVNYFLSCWYKREEFGVRAAIFFSAAAFSGSFGGLLAAAIANLDGLGGRPGWAWIFIIEGVITVGFGLMSFIFVHDFPDTATFLSEQDRARVIRRLKMDKKSSAEHEEFKMEYFWTAIKDYKMWLGMFIYMGADMPLYAFSLFLPTIVAEMGYKTTRAQLLSVPPYACAAVLTIAVGFVADRVIGFAMQLGSQNPHIKYAGTFLGALGIYPCIANTISWVSNNAEGVYKRGIVLGFVIGWGNLNGIVSSNIYFKAPKFTVGHATVMAYMIICLFGGSVAMHLLLRRENATRLAGKRDHWVEGMSEKEAEKLGDKRPDFLYTI
ncbi:hypothetical protein DID88_007583 [Monilinia fructigena]|uniref:Major facilitator superfamily (MFS) profile domain-containing protein n=1 Tax=Monilinia fructigena TaxID=38457 RepID=A0A395J2T8_9HELO|nr:hypothetical protein DID88_007583 [Monilinia fructigena]